MSNWIDVAATDAIERIDWNINDAKEALQCAIGMSNWDGVIKYATQIKDLERKRFDLISLHERTTYVSPWALAHQQRQ